MTGAEPTVADAGDSDVSFAAGCLRVTEMACELPPPGAGLLTEKLRAPTGARVAAGTTAVSWVLLTNVVVSEVVPTMTTDDDMKLVPVRVNVVSAVPA